MRIIRLIFIFLIFFLCLIIFGKDRINKKTDVVKTSTDVIKTTEEDELKYFWEYPPNSILRQDLYYLPKVFDNPTNNDGLNEFKNYDETKDQDTYRIITLGGGYVFGEGVETQNNWTEILERKLNEKKICKNINKFEVINFGSNGFDYQYSVEKYRRKGIKYNSDLIIWMLAEPYQINNIERKLVMDCNNKYDINTQTAETRECYSKIGDIYKILNFSEQDFYNIQQKNISKIREFYNKNIFFIDLTSQNINYIKNIKGSIYISDFETEKYLLKNNSFKKMTYINDKWNNLGHKTAADIIFKEIFKQNQINCEYVK